MNPSDWLGMLCFLAFFLGIVTVFGHGIWVLLATIFRALAGEQKIPPHLAGRPCPYCHRTASVING